MAIGTIKVTLNAHGLLAGQTFTVQVSTTVGGITLLGVYTVSSVVDVNNFNISVPSAPTTTQSVSENSGLMQVAAQTQDPIDNIMTPFGRTDYAMIPDKYVQGRPTAYWFNRQIVPQISLWQVPDGNGPYQLQMWRMRRLQDANATMGENPDVPYRFFDAMCARLSERLAMKYAKEMLPVLEKEALKAWTEAGIEDRERADIMIMPMLDGYYRD